MVDWDTVENVVFWLFAVVGALLLGMGLGYPPRLTWDGVLLMALFMVLGVSIAFAYLALREARRRKASDG